jgi:hypothetical protein
MKRVCSPTTLVRYPDLSLITHLGIDLPEPAGVAVAGCAEPDQGIKVVEVKLL